MKEVRDQQLIDHITHIFSEIIPENMSDKEVANRLSSVHFYKPYTY